MGDYDEKNLLICIEGFDTPGPTTHLISTFIGKWFPNYFDTEQKATNK